MSGEGPLPAPDPVVHDDTAPYWEAAADGRLVLPRCSACATYVWYPRRFCPACASTDVEWTELPGTGTVYSFAVARRGQGAYRDSAPYVVAYVELDLPHGGPGPRMMTNVVGCPPDSVSIGDRVTVVFDGTESGHALPRFRLAEDGIAREGLRG
jgi:uncharacterized protein